MRRKRNDVVIDFEKIAAIPKFPEKVEYIISPEEALQVMHQALEKIKNYQDSQLHIFKTLVGPLVPDSMRSQLEKWQLDQWSIPYRTLVNNIGNVLNAFVLFNLDERMESINENSRLIVLPYLELTFRKKIEQLEAKKPFGWRITRKFYQRNLDDLSPLVDNLIRLITLAWTFCPAIGEPEQETGFFNRFIFTANGGFIDLGHFFNCAIIAYLYGAEQADRRAAATEIQQRQLREKRWLVKLHERNHFRLLTTLLWGYATSADTIEDRASDKFGIQLGQTMRADHDNGKIIDYYVDFYIKSVKKSIRFLSKKSSFARIIETIALVFKNLFYTAHQSSTFDLENYMKNFFDEYDAIDPNDYTAVPQGIFNETVDFYTEKYGSANWDQFTCKEWCAVMPQELWEKVVRSRKSFQGNRVVPLKIQLKKSGKLVDPYQGKAPAIG